jgi:GT2 family glycosyltransferase
MAAIVTNERSDAIAISERARRLSVSALVCTRHRPDSVVRTVLSILRPQTFCSQLLVIDQSDDSRTEAALRPFFRDPRLRYIRSSTEGKGRALNVGLAEAKGDIVAITDDDCEVGEGWPRHHLDVFAKHPRVAVTFGNVLAVEHDPKKGFIPAYISTHDRLCRNIWHKLSARGIGANMTVRRKVVIGLGGFDPALGPGGQFFACVDGDMTVRCLLEGYHVYESTRSYVHHHGFRDWEEGRALTRRAWFGIGAAYVKPLKCGRWGALPVLLYEFLQGALLPFLWATLTFRRPKGWLRVISFLQGALQGCRAPVDREKILFRTDSEH